MGHAMTFRKAVLVAVVVVAWGLLIEAPSIIHGGTFASSARLPS